jgi:hypothetical protein
MQLRILRFYPASSSVLHIGSKLPRAMFERQKVTQCTERDPHLGNESPLHTHTAVRRHSVPLNGTRPNQLPQNVSSEGKASQILVRTNVNTQASTVRCGKRFTAYTCLLNRPCKSPCIVLGRQLSETQK